MAMKKGFPPKKAAKKGPPAGSPFGGGAMPFKNGGKVKKGKC